MFFSIYALINEEFDCKQISDGWEFIKYSNPGQVTEVNVDFAYSDITEIYLPVGLKSIGTLGFFKAEKLKKIYSYTCANAVASTDWNAVSVLSSVYRSLPDTVEFIGSDAFIYDRGITYMFIPSSVKEIGHHAFFNMAYKSGDEIEGLAKMNVQPDEASFSSGTKAGDSWLPKIDAGLFKKNVDVVYSSERETVH